MIDWAWGKTFDGTRDGWNHDGAVADFRSNRLKSLTREIIQNSLDAATENSLVTIKMEEKQLPLDRIPNIETLKDTLKRCLEDVGDGEEDSAQKEMKRVYQELCQGNNLSVLSISDSGTKGMCGPCEAEKPFYRYIKTRGDSSGSNTRAGSHGLGKAAPLCLSELRTIIVSTVWDQGEALQQLIQGRASFRSHKRDGQLYGAIGFWGKEFKPIVGEECPEKYDWIVRDPSKCGTTIHVLGWTKPDNWQKIVLGYAAMSFFAAFEREKLLLELPDHNLNKENIKEVFDDPNIKEAMRKEDQKDNFLNAQFFQKCISNNPQVLLRKIEPKHLKESELRFLVTEEATQKIAVIRKNMLITDQLKGFRRTQSRYRNFCGVFECLDKDGRELIREMEPPAHDRLSADEPLSTENQTKAKEALHDLTEKLKKIVDELATVVISQEGRISILDEYLYDEAGDDETEIQYDGQEQNPNGNFLDGRLNVPIVPPEDPSGIEEEFEDDENGATEVSDDDSLEQEENYESDDDFDGLGEPRIPDDDGVTTESGPDPVHQINLRDVRVVKKSDKVVKMFMTSQTTGSTTIQLFEVAADFVNNTPLIVSKVYGQEGILLANGTVSVSFDRDERKGIEVELEKEVVAGIVVKSRSS